MSARVNRILLGTCTVVLAGGAIYLARPVIAPVAFALFVIALVWPLQERLQRRLPGLAAMAIDVAPYLPSFITGLCSRSGPFWTALQTRWG